MARSSGVSFSSPWIGAVWPHATSRTPTTRTAVRSRIVGRSRDIIDPLPRWAPAPVAAVSGGAPAARAVTNPMLRAAPPLAIPACGAPLALAPGGEPVEVADEVEVFEEIELLDHLVLLQETELATDGRFLERDGVRARRRLTPAPHRDE